MKRTKTNIKKGYDYIYVLNALEGIVESQEEKEAIAKAVYKEFKNKSSFLLPENPHILSCFGADFFAVEEKFKEASPFNPYRMIAVVKLAYKYIVSSGSTYALLPQLIRQCDRILPEPVPHFLLYQAISEYYEYDKENDSVTDSAIGMTERRIARNLKEIIAKVGVGTKITETDDHLDESQKEAVLSLSGEPVAILTGGPGTGKTSCVAKAIADGYDGNVVLIAPTGVASRRLSEATGRPDAGTIHRTFSLFPNIDGTYGHAKEIPTNSLVICDEASMLDIFLFDVILQCCRESSSRLLLIGDQDQLPSIREGNVFGDLIDCMRIPVCHLTQTHRSANPLIKENVQRIKDGNFNLVSGSGFRIENHLDQEKIAKRALGWMKKLVFKDGLSISDVKILCPVRQSKYTLSVETLNASAHRMFFPASQREYEVGEPVICLSNDYSLKVYNGDTGIVHEIVEDGVVVEMEDGRKVDFSGCMENISLSYAISIHKSQGSGYRVPIIILPTEAQNMLNRPLLYVAVSRGISGVVMLCDGAGSTLYDCIRTDPVRNTTLGELLRVKRKEGV